MDFKEARSGAEARWQEEKEKQAENIAHHSFGGPICDSIFNTRLSSWNDLVLKWEKRIQKPVI